MIQEKLHILLIEDDRVDQMAFRRMFEEKCTHCTWRLAETIQEAKNILERETFDLVVTDYMLGDGVGLEIIDQTNGAPVIVITGSGDEETAVKVLKAGAYDYLVKDMDRRYLKVFPLTVENVMKRKNAEEIREKKEKLRGVIEMAGAACHELNQPLQAISGYAELVMMDLDENHPLYPMIAEIKKESVRLGEITRKLNNITRYETVDYISGRRIIDINRASDSEDKREMKMG
jgi:DNA-binding NtrC family response regulator